MILTKKQFINLYLDNEVNENDFDSDGKLNLNKNSKKKTGLIARIFEEHWDKVLKKHKVKITTLRSNACKEVEKIIKCFNKMLGTSVYQCPHCKDIKFVNNTCKSRFCSSCGYKYKEQRVEKILQTAHDCNHRQIVFTIPKELRKYFFNFKRIPLLFEAVNKTINSILNDSYKYSKKQKKCIKHVSSIKYQAGFFSFLHTFGRDMKWNPHIHVLIAERKISNSNIETWNYFNYDSLSKRFMKILLDLLYNDIGPSFYNEKCLSYKNHKNGFYVYAEPKKFSSFKNGIEYVTRYCGRVPISENRIKNYDGENVTFEYNAHEDDSLHEVTVSAEEFILLLIQHLLPENLKIIRYYGFYRKKHKLHDKIKMLVDSKFHKIRNLGIKHEFLIMKYFNYNPYICPKCDIRYEYLLTLT